jgi:dTDP-4-dehydrorhamnose 3,5-epimerase
MEFIKTEIPDVILIQPKVFGDDRGFFFETFRANQFSLECADIKFVQDNQSGSQQWILRGLHYQTQHPQGKLIRVVSGEIFDVAVDLRRSSQTFGKWVGRCLSAQNRLQLWIPPKFAHGFLVLSEWAEVVYKETDYYAPEFEQSIIWNDPTINIEWPLPIGQMPILSAKDNKGKSLIEAQSFS